VRAPAYESLLRVTQVVIKPEDPKKEMTLTFREEAVGDGGGYFVGPLSRHIDLGYNTTYEIHRDYPEEFKKLVAALGGDKDKAYEVYQALQLKTPENWDETVPEEAGCGGCDYCG
jgi:hypothetical protein